MRNRLAVAMWVSIATSRQPARHWKDAMQQCADHAKSAHGMDEIPPELAEKVQAAIREV
jgi:predicted small metal-binding protein